MLEINNNGLIDNKDGRGGGKIKRKNSKMLDLMSKEKEDVLKRGKKIFLLVSIIVLSCSIMHGQYGQNITTISVAVTTVAGNGSGVNGTEPFDQR